MSKESATDRKRARFERLPPIAQRLIKNRAAALKLLAAAPLARLMFEAGFSPTPGMGLAEHDACVAIIKDALGIEPLTDGEFECALRLTTPPECRETAQ